MKFTSKLYDEWEHNFSKSFCYLCLFYDGFCIKNIIHFYTEVFS